MKPFKIISSILLITAGLSLPVGRSFAEETAPVQEKAAVSVKALYQCPMHHQVVSDKPGQCPICHMTLVLIQQEGTAGNAQATDHSVVNVSAENVKRLGIRTAKAQNGPLIKTTRLLGQATHDMELFEAQVEYVRSLRQTRLYLRDAYPRQRVLSPTEADVSKLKLMQLGMDEASIAQLDENSLPDKRLLHLSYEDQSWVYGPVYEYEMFDLRAEDKAWIEIPSLPGKMLEGQLVNVAPFVDPATRTARVRVLVEDPEHLIRPEMSVNIIIHSELGEALLVPEEAVFLTGEEAIVFVEKTSGSYEPRHVLLGRRGDEVYEIKGGLSAGEAVVISGNFLIDSESRLKAAVNALQEGRSHD